MRRIKNALMVIAGIIIGMLISVPVVSAASEYLTAVRSTQTFYMDGQRLNLEAYSINGNNYVKLHVDVAYNDHNNTDSMLLAESYPNHPDQVPEATEFLKELLVPGSTK